MRRTWDGASRLRVAIVVDVDGTLVSPYRHGQRELRQSALTGLRLLASQAPVFLWSSSGADNGIRLLREFPELQALVLGCYGKEDFPVGLVDQLYAIDDDGCDEAVKNCHVLAFTDSYFGGHDSGLFFEAASRIVEDLKASSRSTGDPRTSRRRPRAAPGT